MYINEEILSHAYADEVVLKLYGSVVQLKKIEMGRLHLPTGHIVANDPCLCFETAPFTITVAPGHYDVSISVVHFPPPEDPEGKSGQIYDRRVALAMLKFSDKKAVRWEMALTSGNDGVDTLAEGDFFGYGVDSGTGGFADKEIIDKIVQIMDDAHKNNDNSFYDKMDTEMHKTYVPTYSYLLTNITGGDEKQLACFSSGDGDGAYPSYFGFDEEGKPCCVVTDFCMF